MVSNQFKIYLVSISLFSLCCEVLRAQDSASLLFQAGLYAEEVQGDLDKALAYYDKIVKQFPDDRPVAAKALLHIGFCYEKLGQEQAEEAFRKIVEEYPDQREVAAVARDRLLRSEKSKMRIPKSQIEENPLVRYYFERIGIDPLTSTSWDGNYLAYTDWTIGSLMISSEFGMRNFDFGERKLKSAISNPKSAVRIVTADFSRSREFAYNPVFSRDGKWLAYSWYRAPFFVELRVVSVANGQSRVLYSNPDLVIFPQDWTPDGQSVLCKAYYPGKKLENQNHIITINANTGKLKELIPLGTHSRGIKYSPDGRYITYDLPVIINRYTNRYIYVFDLEQAKERRVTGGYPETNDTPVWSPDGKLILYHSSRLGKYDLWALPIKNGKPAGYPYLLQSEMNKVLLSMLGWSYRQSYQPNFTSSWYWEYPGLEIIRPLFGDRWVLETRVSYSIVDGANARNFALLIFFDPERDLGTLLTINRMKEFGKQLSKILIQLLDQCNIVAKNQNCLARDDTLGVIEFTYYYRISRADTLISVELSEDDVNYKNVLKGTLRAELRGLPQRLALTALSWYVPAGSYADWDYIRFKILDK